MRRPRVSWLTQTDDRLLETLEDSGLILSPRILATNPNYSRHYVSERVAVLIEGSLVEKEKEVIYRITEKDKQYFVGDLDTDKLQLEEE